MSPVDKYFNITFYFNIMQLVCARVLSFSIWTDLVNISERMRHAIAVRVRIVSYMIIGLFISLDILLNKTVRQKLELSESQNWNMRKREVYDRQG